MHGLSDDDALALWRSAGISGSREVLVQLFKSFEGHPLLVRTLAGEIARDRKSPSDFDKWKVRHPDFDPFKLPLVQRKSHVLEYALKGLTSEELALLRTIAGFRMPVAYETLAALLVGKGKPKRPFLTEEPFDRALADLDDRGLLGWDRRANRYDLHPIIRGVVWSGAAEGDRRVIAERMRAHFAPMPTLEWEKVERLDDLTPAIELYVSLIRLWRFDEAFSVFQHRLSRATLHRLSASRQRVELLEMLFTRGTELPPRLQLPLDQSYALNAIAQGYQFSGQPGRALPCFQRAAAVDREANSADMAVAFSNLSDVLRITGALHSAEANALRGLGLARTAEDEFGKAVSLYRVGLTRAARGLTDAEAALHRSLRILHDLFSLQGVSLLSRLLAQAALWRGEPATAGPLADSAWELAGVERNERDFIGAARLQGDVALALRDLDRADERLHLALTRARAVNLVEEELAALTALAALHLRRGDIARARELLDGVWEAAERGPYPLLHADAKNVLAEIEIHENNRDAAVAAATAAYRLAWCDGPPFAYDYGLRTARAHLKALGVPEPDMPPYDPSKHEPIEDIPIDPPDEDVKPRSQDD
jgi:tetratricopeptide (TPR) repeat protein